MNRVSPRLDRVGNFVYSRLIVAGFLLFFALCLGPTAALAVHDAGVFELDGNSIPPTVRPPDDFDNVYLGTSLAYDYAFIDDSPLPDASVHAAGNKDGRLSGDPAQRIFLNSGTASKNWGCVVSNNVTNKLDIRSLYYGAYNVGGEAIAYFGADRDTVDGDANIGFWFFQDRVICDPATGTFTGHKRDGDILIVGPFTGGGGIANVDVYRWTDPTPGAPESQDEYLALIISGGDCATAPAGDDICATANGAVFNAAWRPSMPKNAFFEGGINLSALQPDTCYRSMMAETRSSQSLTASLEDFAFAEVFTCGSISVEKVTDPSGDPQLFDFVTAGGPAPGVSDPFQLKDGDPTHVTLNLLPGQYSVTELTPLPTDWVLTGAQCRGGSFGTGGAYNNGSLFALALGDKVVCTFVNTYVTPPEPPTITVDKVTIPANHPQLFSFAVNDGTSNIDSFQLTDADPSHSTLVSAGTYTITETIPAGWDLTGIVCRGGPFGEGAPYINGAQIALNAGDKVVCTFTDTLRTPSKPTAITVQKVTNPAGSSQEFSFVTAGGPAPGVTDPFNLTDGTMHTTANLFSGTYTVTETVPSGWTLSATCVGGPFGAGALYVNGSGINLAEGDQVVCTFTNSLPSIIVDKVTIPAGASQLFSFVTAGGTISDSFQLADATAPHATWVMPGSYKVTETVPTGWVQTATCVGGSFGAGGPYTNGASFTVNAGDQITCTFTNRRAPTVASFCSKSEPQTVLNPTSGRFKNNKGLDVVVRTDLGESIQSVLNTVVDYNGDGFIIVGVSHSATGAYGGHPVQSVDITRDYPLPFGLFGCSVTLHDPTPGDAAPAGHIASTASAPVPTGQTGNIFVMDLHGADSKVAGWKVDGNGRYLRNVYGTNNATGVWFAGDNNTMQNGKGESNTGVGILIEGKGNKLDTTYSYANGGTGIQVTGDSNVLLKTSVGDISKGNAAGIIVAGSSSLLQENKVYANKGLGIQVTGNNNQLLKNAVGDLGKGNLGPATITSGSGNLLQENTAYANGGDGINVSGGTAASPNRLYKNTSGSSGKGNQGNGIVLSGTGNGTLSPIEIEQNTAKANTLNGFKVDGSGHQLKNNVSGGSTAGENNGDCEYLMAAGNINATGNKSNGVTIAGTNGSAFPTGCIGTP